MGVFDNQLASDWSTVKGKPCSYVHQPGVPCSRQAEYGYRLMDGSLQLSKPACAEHGMTVHEFCDACGKESGCLHLNQHRWLCCQCAKKGA